MERRDYLRECNTERVALPTFTEEWCAHCLNPECSRSQYGKSKFDQRVSTWLERLFTEVAKLDPNDPRFAKINAQKFLTISTDGAITVGTSSWDDPRDLASKQEALDAALAQAVPDAPVVEPEPAFNAPAAELAPAKVPPQADSPVPEVGPDPEVRTKPTKRPPRLVNVPPQQGGQMLGGRPLPTKPQSPSGDAWDAPAEEEKPPVGIIVPSGSTIKMGG